MIYISGRAKKKKKSMLYSLWKMLPFKWELFVYYWLKICLLPSDQVQEPLSNLLIYMWINSFLTGDFFHRNHEVGKKFEPLMFISYLKVFHNTSVKRCSVSCNLFCRGKCKPVPSLPVASLTCWVFQVLKHVDNGMWHNPKMDNIWICHVVSSVVAIQILSISSSFLSSFLSFLLQ